MKFIVIKYALTSGPFVFEGKQSIDYPDSITDDRGWNHFHKGEWCKTKREAYEAVTAMYNKRRKSLLKSLDALPDKLTKAIGKLNKIEL